MIINEEENVWAHTQVTSLHATEFFGMPAKYDDANSENDLLWLDYPGSEGRQVRIRVPKSHIKKHGWVQIMPLLKQRLGFFAEDINTNWVITDDSMMMPDPMDFQGRP
jgi:hypothetical protein